MFSNVKDIGYTKVFVSKFKSLISAFAIGTICMYVNIQ